MTGAPPDADGAVGASEAASGGRARLPASMRIAAGVVLSVALGALFAGDVDWTEVRRAIGGASAGWLLAALLAMCVNLGLGTLRWAWLLRGAGHPVPLGRAAAPALTARGANDLLPLRGGDMLRAVAARTQLGVPLPTSAGVFMVERLLDGLSLALLLTAGALTARSSGGWLAGGAALLVLTVGGLAAIALAARRGLIATGARRITPLLPRRARGRMRRIPEQLERGGAAVGSPGRLVVAVAVSVGMWGAEAAAFGLAGVALGLHLAVGSYLLIQGAGNLSLAAPTAPAGLGTFDYVTLLATRNMHAAPAVAGAYVLVAHALLTVPSGIVGVLLAPLLVRRRGARSSGAAPPGRSAR